MTRLTSKVLVSLDIRLVGWTRKPHEALSKSSYDKTSIDLDTETITG